MPFDAANYHEIPLLQRDPKTLTDPRERLEYLRDFLRERVPVGQFDMSAFGVHLWEDPACGTSACIGGWGRVLFAPSEVSSYLALNDVGTEKLGLSAEQAQDLFWPMSPEPDGYILRATPTQAANVLDHLLKTGEVDWSVA